MMKPPMPLSKSASAVQTMSAPSSPLAPLGNTFTLAGAGGGVVSLTAPVLTYSIHAFATASLGSQTDALGSHLNAALGTASLPMSGASHALDVFMGIRVCVLLFLSGKR